MSGAANRDRGARAELAVAKYLRCNGFPHARRYLAGDGRQPGDVDFHPDVCLEVKDWVGSRWPTWRAQAVAESRPGQLVVVVRRVRGVTDAGLWETQISHHDVERLTWPEVPALAGERCHATGSTWHFVQLAWVVRHLQPRIPGLETA